MNPELPFDDRGADAIYRALHEDILGGDLLSGEFLREEDLAARFGVSRTPVREALRRLESERILERYNRGRRVPLLSEAETIQAYRLRALLEGEAGAQAAESRSATDLMDLDRLRSRDRAVGTSGRVRLIANFEFHSTLWASTHNPMLAETLHGIVSRLSAGNGSTLTEPRWRSTLDEHDALVEAVRTRDADAARRLAAGHVDAALDVRIAIMRGEIPPVASA